jgi:hypothetical protein
MRAVHRAIRTVPNPSLQPILSVLLKTAELNRYTQLRTNVLPETYRQNVRRRKGNK